MTKPPLSELARLYKTLAHPGRLRLLAMLRGGPLCVCQMTAVLRLAASTVSGHLSELRTAGLVIERKEGKWVEYRLAQDPAALAGVAWGQLERDPVVIQDRTLLRELRKVPLEDLCRVELDLGRLGIRLPSRSASPRLRELR